MVFPTPNDYYFYTPNEFYVYNNQKHKYKKQEDYNNCNNNDDDSFYSCSSSLSSSSSSSASSFDSVGSSSLSSSSSSASSFDSVDTTTTRQRCQTTEEKQQYQQEQYQSKQQKENDEENHRSSTMESPPSSYIPLTTVNIIRGDYKGQSATIANSTSKMVYVQLHDGRKVRIYKNSISILATPQQPQTKKQKGNTNYKDYNPDNNTTKEFASFRQDTTTTSQTETQQQLNQQSEQQNKDEHCRRSIISSSSRNSSTASSSSSSYIPSTKVNIIRGAYTGKSATIIKATKKMVSVCLLDGRTVRISKNSISFPTPEQQEAKPKPKTRTTNAQMGHKNCENYSHSRHNSKECSSFRQDTTTTSQTETQQQQTQQSEQQNKDENYRSSSGSSTPSSSSSSSFKPSTKVNIIRGTYKGKSATIIKETMKMVSVCLDDGRTVRISKNSISFPTPEQQEAKPIPKMKTKNTQMRNENYKRCSYNRHNSKIFNSFRRDTTTTHRTETQQRQTQRSEQLNNNYNSTNNTTTKIPFPTTAETNKKYGIHKLFGLSLESINLSFPNKKHDIDRTLAKFLFGDRIKRINIPLISSRSLAADMKVPPSFQENAMTYQLLCTKVHRKKTGNLCSYFANQDDGKISLYYVAVSSLSSSTTTTTADNNNNIKSIQLQDELEKIANFPYSLQLSSSGVGKIASRLQLLFTTAAICNRKARLQRDYLIFDTEHDNITSDDFEFINEDNNHCNEGCGYIPRSYIEKMLGKYSVGKRTATLQIRLICPKLGFFKGILHEKLNISKIQLHKSSMMKLHPANDYSTSSTSSWACLLIKGRFPSTANINLYKMLMQPTLNLRSSSRNTKNKNKNKKKPNYNSKPLSEMLLKLWNCFGIPKPIVVNYQQQYLQYPQKYQKHTFLIGVADPTNGGIPEGHIFIPKLKALLSIQDKYDINNDDRDQRDDNNYENDSLSHVFVTRFPCVTKRDGLLLPIVTKKPNQMTIEQWDFLESLEFSSVIFGNSRKGLTPLPNLIANGDLDGDLYFVCWDRCVVNSTSPTELIIPPLIVENNETEENNNYKQQQEDDKLETETNTNRSHWLEKTQHFMGDIPTLIQFNELIVELYKAWNKEGMEKNKNNRDEDDHDDDDLYNLGMAFQKSLDVQKHGGFVYLPQHLWDHIPNEYHRFLTDCQ